MPTPYDNTDDGGFTRAEYRIAAMHDIDLDAPAQVRCDSCNKLAEADELNQSGECATCHAEQAAAFLTAPTMDMCRSLMGAR